MNPISHTNQIAPISHMSRIDPIYEPAPSHLKHYKPWRNLCCSSGAAFNQERELGKGRMERTCGHIG